MLVGRAQEMNTMNIQRLNAEKAYGQLLTFLLTTYSSVIR